MSGAAGDDYYLTYLAERDELDQRGHECIAPWV